MKVIVVLFCVFLQQVVVHSKVLPDYLPTPCFKNDPNYEACLLKYIKEYVHPLASKGIPSLEIPPWDPLVLSSINVKLHLSQNTDVSALLNNLKITGIANYNVEELKIDLDKQSWKIRAVFPSLHIETDHKVSGRFLGTPVKTKGAFEGNLTDARFAILVNLKRYQNKGVAYLKVDKVALDAIVGGGQVKINSDDPKFQDASDTLAAIFNSDPQAISDLIRPIVSKMIIPTFKDIINQYLSKVPANELLPED